MRQILIVGSQADRRFKPFFEKVFPTVGVATLWETYERITSGPKGLETFQEQVRTSDAIFLVLDENMQALCNARAWSFGKPGFTGNKDLWVFEHCEDMKRISLRVPDLKHHVAFYITNAWNDYVQRIAETVAAGGTPPLPAGHLELPSPATMGEAFNGTSGMALFDHSTARPTGAKCLCPQCGAAYDLHLPIDMRIVRCRVCGTFCELKAQAPAPVAAEAVPA